MKALRFDRFGDPSVLRIEEVPGPEPTGGEVLVRAATQIANWKGARVIGGVLGSDPLPGVVAVVDTQAGNVADQVREKIDVPGVDAVLDAVGGTLFEAGLNSLRPGGRQVGITSVLRR